MLPYLYSVPHPFLAFLTLVLSRLSNWGQRVPMKVLLCPMLESSPSGAWLTDCKITSIALVLYFTSCTQAFHFRSVLIHTCWCPIVILDSLKRMLMDLSLIHI